MALGIVKFDMFPQDVGRRLYMPYHVEGQHALERVESTVNTIEDYLFSRQEEFNIRSIYSYYDRGPGRVDDPANRSVRCDPVDQGNH